MDEAFEPRDVIWRSVTSMFSFWARNCKRRTVSANVPPRSWRERVGVESSVTKRSPAGVAETGAAQPAFRRLMRFNESIAETDPSPFTSTYGGATVPVGGTPAPTVLRWLVIVSASFSLMSALLSTSSGLRWFWYVTFFAGGGLHAVGVAG